jgi:hypothetical protein
MTTRAFRPFFPIYPAPNIIACWLFLAGGILCAADYPAPQAGDFIIRGFHFQSGEVLPELRVQ